MTPGLSCLCLATSRAIRVLVGSVVVVGMAFVLVLTSFLVRVTVELCLISNSRAVACAVLGRLMVSGDAAVAEAHRKLPLLQATTMLVEMRYLKMLPVRVRYALFVCVP